MKTRIVVLGAGFGGLEVSTELSSAFGDSVDITLIDQADSFVFGFSKLDVLFGHAEPQSVKLPYRELKKPGVRLLRESITAIDPVTRTVTTNAGTHQADCLVVALGADYDFAATPGIVRGRDEFYTVEGAEYLRTVLPSFTRGHAVVGGCGAPFKCPPAPSECALMLHDYLLQKGLRTQCEITLVLPLSAPVPPSPDTSKALIEAFAERNIRYLPNRRVTRLDPAKKVATLDDGSELPCELFLGIPKHRAPDVVRASPLAEGGDYVPVNPKNLETKFPGVYALGDCSLQQTPKAGTFAEAAARVAAANIIHRIKSGKAPAPFSGQGSCYIEFGAGRIARVDVDFFSGPKPTGVYQAPSTALRAEKNEFGRSRRAKWFGRSS